MIASYLGVTIDLALVEDIGDFKDPIFGDYYFKVKFKNEKVKKITHTYGDTVKSVRIKLINDVNAYRRNSK